MLRILIADDHEVVRFGLRQILEAQANWEVVAEASDGKEAVSRAIETKPDICIVDHSLPLMNGLEVTRQIRARVPKSEILIFTMHENEKLVQELLQRRCQGISAQVGRQDAFDRGRHIAGEPPTVLHPEGLRDPARRLLGKAREGVRQ